MAIVLDNNILVRLTDQDDPQHLVARDALTALRAGGEELVLIPQAAREFWVVATRPVEVNGLGRLPDEARAILTGFEQFFTLRADNAEVHENWKTLVAVHKVSGKTAHDAGYVAAMQAHGIASLLTFNGAGFLRYRSEIRILTPNEVLVQRPG